MPNKAAETSNRAFYQTLIKWFHLIAALQFCYGIYYDFSYVPLFGSNKFGGKFKYLTVIDAVN